MLANTTALAIKLGRSSRTVDYSFEGTVHPLFDARQTDGACSFSTSAFISKSSYSLMICMHGSSSPSRRNASPSDVGRPSCITHTGGPQKPCLYPYSNHCSAFICDSDIGQFFLFGEKGFPRSDNFLVMSPRVPDVFSHTTMVLCALLFA